MSIFYRSHLNVVTGTLKNSYLAESAKKRKLSPFFPKWRQLFTTFMYTTLFMGIFELSM